LSKKSVGRTNHGNVTSFIIRYKKMLDEPTTETLRPLLLGIDIDYY
jgi:hypothetical protein